MSVQSEKLSGIKVNAKKLREQKFGTSHSQSCELVKYSAHQSPAAFFMKENNIHKGATSAKPDSTTKC